MKKFVKISLFWLLLLFSAQAVSAQGRFGIGFTIEPVLCFTDLAPRLKEVQETSPRFQEILNYSSGLKVDYQMANGLAFTSGIDFSRKRFGFLHEESSDGQDISLWGHSEYHTFEVPLIVSYVILSSSKPFYEIAPFAGITFGGDISSYRNLTREDENFSYNYYFDHENYQRSSFVSTVKAGLKIKTIIDQLGVIHWGFTFATDITMLPAFDYQVSYNDVPVNYTQQIRMNYISLGLTYYFTTWEVFNGKFMKRSFN